MTLACPMRARVKPELSPLFHLVVPAAAICTIKRRHVSNGPIAETLTYEDLPGLQIMPIGFSGLRNYRNYSGSTGSRPLTSSFNRVGGGGGQLALERACCGSLYKMSCTP